MLLMITTEASYDHKNQCGIIYLLNKDTMDKRLKTNPPPHYKNSYIVSDAY